MIPTLERMPAEEAVRQRCFDRLELVDMLAQTPPEAVRERPLRARAVEHAWHREAGSRLAR